MSAAKEYFRLRRNIAGLTDGQVSVCDVDWDSGRLDQFRVVVSPNSGLYKGGRFVFRIRLPNEYPCTEATPSVYCETNVLHPNIDCRSALEDEEEEEEEEEDEYDEEFMYVDNDDNNVCLNLFSEEGWHSSYGLESIALGLLFLMHNPNFDEPLIEFFEESDPTEYIIAIEKNMEDLRIAKEHEGANSSGVTSDDKGITETLEVAYHSLANKKHEEAQVSENKNNKISGEPKDVFDITNETLQQTENNTSDAKEDANIDEVVGETPDGLATRFTVFEDRTGSKEDVTHIGETIIGIDAMHLCVTQTSEQYVEGETNEDTIHTRLVL